MPAHERKPGAAGRVVRSMSIVAAGSVILGLVAVTTTQVAASANADVRSDEQAAVQAANAAGYRTGIGVIDVRTGAYYGAGEDTASFASESVAKVLIATELLLTGQMSGETEATAFQMISESDDDAADDLYALAGGDNVINLVASHYGIADLGTSPVEPGWWGDTEITAKGIVEFYAAVAKDPTVGPWLINAMAKTTEYAADGTDQFFGLPSATLGAAVKQGWGDDGTDSPNAVFNSTGYVDTDRYAVAILVDGPPDSYGNTIGDMVTTEADALMPGGQIASPVDDRPVITNLKATATGSTVRVTGRAIDPDASGGVALTIVDGARTVATDTTSANHSFEVSFLASNGVHVVTVTAANGSAGTTTATAPAVTVDGSPRGSVTSVTGGISGVVTVTGAETDPNLGPDLDAGMSVSVDGVARTVNVPSTGAQYSISVPAPPGSDGVTVTYDGTDGASDVVQGSWIVQVGQARPARSRTSQVKRIVGLSYQALALLAFV
jgi:hypothetical protein